DPARRLSRVAERGDDDREQQGDDGDDHEELDQRESPRGALAGAAWPVSASVRDRGHSGSLTGRALLVASSTMRLASGVWKDRNVAACLRNEVLKDSSSCMALSSPLAMETMPVLRDRARAKVASRAPPSARGVAQGAGSQGMT